MVSRQALDDIIKEYQMAEGEEYIHSAENSIVCSHKSKTIGCVEPWLSGGFHHSSRTQQQWKMVNLIVLLPSGFELQYGAEFQSENEYDHRLRDGVL